ncbi:MAG TPA: universal stress protein [Ktedonobacterales bacterium]|nr:universal stress protein [Ktedonobacterales bacterium]
MFETIYVPVDNSDYSNASVDVAIELARAFGSRLVGSHVYAARMHDYRFKQMEYTLPEEYQDEQELERQRKIHDTLITRGLRLISDSYLDVMEARCAMGQLPFQPKTFDGQNWQELVKDIEASRYDLVIMGALGMGAVKESQIGSVCERVLRRIRSDTLVIKDTRPLREQQGGSIAVAIDGSPQSFGGLKIAIELGRALNRPVEAIAVYDPYLHYSVFNSIVDVLSQEASKVFRFKEQEQLHEEIIDTGLAKIYESHLQIAKTVAAEEGVELKVTLMDGKAWDKILQWTRRERPWLLVMGRIGVHSAQEMDIGSNSHNLLQQVPCNVLMCSSTYVPQIDIRAEATITWTHEASARMERVPVFVRGIARTAIHRYAMERGHSVISNSIVDDAVRDILPESAARAMGVAAKQLAIEEQAQSIEQDTTYICGECGYAARNVLPVACPVCHSGPERFTLIDKRLIETAAAQEGPVSEEESFDGVKVKWTEDAKKLLWTMTDAYARRRAKARIEKMARVQRLPAVTVDFASPVVQETIGDLSALHANTPLALPTNDQETAEEAASAAPAAAEAAEATSAGRAAATGLEEAAPITWTPEAQQRLARVPEGYMREMTEDIILKHAGEQGAPIITLATAEAGIEIAKGEMVRMMEARLAHQQKQAQKKAAKSQANGACPVPHASGADSTADSMSGSGGCPVPRGEAAAVPVVAAAQPAFTDAAREQIETLAQRSESSGKASAERASELVENVAVQRAGQKGLNEVTPDFIAQMGKKLGYGHPASEKTYELDFVWTAEALAKLEEVPDFCRELTRWRVEWTAYKKNLGRLITPETMEAKYSLWGEASEHIRERQEPRLPWTSEAQQRLHKVPDFVKGQVIQSVEGNARQMGCAEVTGTVLDRVIEKWRATGDFHEGRYGYK